MRLGMALVLIGLLFPSSLLAQTHFDTLIRNGRVLDGTANPWYYADIAISNGRLAAVGDLRHATADRLVDATGLYVSPGFIDTHSHAGPGLATPELSPGHPLLAQGITTVVVNPDGGGPVDISRHRVELLRNGLGVNVAQFVPHGSIRREVIGMEDRPPTAAELSRMKDLVRNGMMAGAIGLSSGPFYPPGSYSTTDELVELAKIAAEFGGVYSSHIRDESDYTVGLVHAVDEVIQIADEANLVGIVTHIKALGPNVWGYSQAVNQRISRARDRGVQVYADQYPYEASGSGVSSALVPRWAQVGGDSALIRRIDDPSESARLRDDMVENLARRGGAHRLQFRRHEADPSIEGLTLQEVADARGTDPITLATELLKSGGASFVSFNMHDEDIGAFMVQPWTITASDGDLVPMGEGVPHPRGYGTFPRKIRKYVLEEGVVSLSDAIRSMTSLPATVYKLQDRGVIREGAIADVVVFDLERLRDHATYQDPHQLSEGVVYVFVGGEAAVFAEQFLDPMNGKVLSADDRW